MQKSSYVFSLVLQLWAVLQCFMLGFFVMHISYNLDYVHWSTAMAWKVCFMSACALGLAIIGPLALLELTSVQAFVSPSTDVLSSIKAQVSEVWSDLDHIRRQMEDSARSAGYTEKDGGKCPQSWAKVELGKVSGTGTIPESGLQRDLAAVGIHITA